MAMETHGLQAEKSHWQLTADQEQEKHWTVTSNVPEDNNVNA